MCRKIYYLAQVKTIVKIPLYSATGTYSTFHFSFPEGSGKRVPTSKKRVNDYAYGFQGQEEVDEVAGEGNHTTAEYWEYDTRLGRRWNLDPIVKQHESPYAAFANNPIWFIDPNGADSAKVGGTWYWQVEHGDDFAKIGKRTGTTVGNLTEWNSQDPVKLKSGTLLNLKDNGNVHFVYEAFTPEIYNLTVEGLIINPSWVYLNYNGPGSPLTAKNRSYACPQGYCNTSATGDWCDEFPYASTLQGGAGSVTDCVPVEEQQIQAFQLRTLYSGMKGGDGMTVVPVPMVRKAEQKVKVTNPNESFSPYIKPILLVPKSSTIRAGIKSEQKIPSPQIPKPAFSPGGLLLPVFVPEIIENWLSPGVEGTPTEFD